MTSINQHGPAGSAADGNPSWQFTLANLHYILCGKLRSGDGHLPPAGHTVPADFAGVGVATSQHEAADDYILECLQQLGLRQVRLDLSYGEDYQPYNQRLLTRLAEHSISIMLHLVQPAAAASAMETETACAAWRQFVAATLDQYSDAISLLEIGTTVNRKRWAGYTLRGFLAAWQIAHEEARKRHIRLAGPNVTDFEPVFNIGLLAILQRRRQLPDVHTNNLFSERCSEPERFDHKIIGRRRADMLQMNLVKKARLLQRIGAEFGVPALHSPSAFWTLPRIARLLAEAEQKQADYLARYMVLSASTGALQAAYWGPMICGREGLIDDGSGSYPRLERIAHYAAIDGEITGYRKRPAFHALRTFAAHIPGMHYSGPLRTAGGLEVHAFSGGQAVIHAVWTINGRAAALVDLYEEKELSATTCISRDGVVQDIPDIASETPLYLRWEGRKAVSLRPHAALLSDVRIHRHVHGKAYFLYRQNGWQGLILAQDRAQANQLALSLNPEHIAAPTRDALLRKARNAIWTISNPLAMQHKLVIKQPVRMHLHKKLLDRFKPSKAKRSWNGACELLRRGIATASPIAYFEKPGDRSLTQNFYICDYVGADFSARDIFSAFASGAALYQGIGQEEAYRQICAFVLNMHNRGVFFRDLSGGNILISKKSSNTLSCSLIDTGRIHVYNHGVSMGRRLSDLTRICNKLHAAGREQFMSIYMNALGKKFGSWYRWPFHMYNAKVAIKRALKAKKLKTLLKR